MNKYIGVSTLESMSQAGFYNKWTFNKFSKYLRGEILEVGCGTGNFTHTLSRYGKVTAIDIDQVLIETLEKDNNPNINAGYGNIEKREYFFSKKTFDTIICLNVLEHIENDGIALENMYKLLKKGGYLILLVPIHDFLYGEIDKSIGHYRRYKPKELLKKMSDINYSIGSFQKLNFLGAIGWFISGRILRNKKITEGKIKLFNLLSPFLFLEDLVEPPIGTSLLVVAKRSK